MRGCLLFCLQQPKTESARPLPASTAFVFAARDNAGCHSCPADGNLASSQSIPVVVSGCDIVGPPALIRLLPWLVLHLLVFAIHSVGSALQENATLPVDFCQETLAGNRRRWSGTVAGPDTIFLRILTAVSSFRWKKLRRSEAVDSGILVAVSYRRTQLHLESFICSNKTLSP